ncbi:MAG: PD-(D/E)XK nuclease family protein, partial [bacterium]|nr:PD-(D/E)XK nuclease family protein [bacterium]
RRTKGKTYPLKLILEGLSLYNLGWHIPAAARRLKDRFGIMVPTRTLDDWIHEQRDLLTYARLRDRGRALFSPHQVIRATRLYHRQVYMYRIHRAKLTLLINEEDPRHEAFAPLRDFLEAVPKECPHHLFQEGASQRGSEIAAKFDLEGVEIRERENFAPRITAFALQGAPENKQRHDTLEKFMLINDSVTVATEIPVWLTPEDIAYMRSRLGFTIPFPTAQPLTGHIDLLQIRNGAIHILDYKPRAHQDKPLAQLVFYALALSRRTRLPVSAFKCAWFDDEHYFEFFPLHVVYKKKRQKRTARTPVAPAATGAV